VQREIAPRILRPELLKRIHEAGSACPPDPFAGPVYCDIDFYRSSRCSSRKTHRLPVSAPKPVEHFCANPVTLCHKVFRIPSLENSADSSTTDMKFFLLSHIYYNPHTHEKPTTPPPPRTPNPVSQPSISYKLHSS
jgi:hypothetical protein